MSMFRRILIGLCTLLCIASISLLVYLGALQATLLNREVVKTWLSDAGVYKNNLIPSLIQSGADKPQKPDPSTGTASLEIPPAALKLALERTFTSDYARSQLEKTIDSFYEWLEGKASDFTISLPLNEKRDTFVAELVQAAEPTVAQLPICGPALAADTPCRPANIAPDLYAEQIITENIDQSAFFTRPVTAANPQPNLPRIVSYVKPAMIVLVILAFVGAIAAIWMTPIDKRLVALSKLGKRIFFGQIFTFIAAILLIVAFQTGFFKVPTLLADQPPAVAQTITDFIKIALTSVAGQLALFSGLICLVGLSIWIGIVFWRKRHAQVSVIPEETLRY